MIDKRGRYSIQIFRPDRPKFASGAKVTGTADEYREAVLGSGTHTGHVSMDSTNHRLVFTIDTSSGNGNVAYSIWKRAQP